MLLSNFLKLANKTTKQAAIELGFSQADVSRYCTGRVVPRLQRIKKIEEWSNGAVTPNDFYNITERNKDE